MNRTRAFRFVAPMLAPALLCPALWAQDVPVTALFGSGTSAGDEFGSETALVGDWLLVGAPYDHHMDPPGLWLTGRVYAFRRDAAGAWAEAELWLPMLTADFQVGGGAFGRAIALSPEGRLALVGAHGTSYGDHPVIEQGAAYVFHFDEAASGGEGGWVREARLRDPDAQRYAHAGEAVAINGALAVMNGGLYGSNLAVFRHTPGADDGGDGPGGYGFGPWVKEATLTSGDVAGFRSGGGENVAVMDDAAEGERVVGGAYSEDTAAGLEAGAVYVYRNDGPAGGPAAWVLEERLEPGDAAPGRRFGKAVSLSGDGRLLLVGANANAGGPGRAYVFRREGSGAASVWVEEGVLTAGAGGHGFGSGAVLSAEPGTGKPLALVMNVGGVGAGIGELFRREADGGGGFAWERVVAFRDTLRGDSASLDGATAAAGNWSDDTRGERAGRAVVFDLSAFVATAAEPPPPVSSSGLTLSAYPNPARGRAALALVLPEAGVVHVALYDGLGRRVALVHDGPLAAGVHRLSVEVSGLAAGVYLARAEAAAGAAFTRLAVVR